MKLTEIISVRTFKVAHFLIEDNPGLIGAGERTPYVLSSDNKPGGKGFRVIKPAKVVDSKNGTTQLNPGDRIFFPSPARLYRAIDLNQKGTSFYVLVGHSPDRKDAIGYIPISSIEKPTRIDGRVVTGAAGQDEVYKYISEVYGKRHKIVKVSGAIIGSKNADLELSVDGYPVQVEIKNSSSPLAPITFYDKTCRRGNLTPDIDNIMKAITNNPDMTFERYIDRKRRRDRTIGYPGDKGVIAKSGSFPRVTINQGDPAMQVAYEAILQHFVKSGDNYFAINHGNGRVSIFFTGHGENYLGAPMLPVPKAIIIDTYGGAYRGGMRMGVKVHL